MTVPNRGLKPGITENEFINEITKFDISMRNVRLFLRETDFLSIPFISHQVCMFNETSNKFFNKRFTTNQLAMIFNLNPRTIRKYLLNGPQDPKPLGRHLALDSNVEKSIVDEIIKRSKQYIAFTGKELLRYIQKTYNKTLTTGWLHSFLYRHSDMIREARPLPQDDCRLTVPREYLKEYIYIIECC